MVSKRNYVLDNGESTLLLKYFISLKVELTTCLFLYFNDKNNSAHLVVVSGSIGWNSRAWSWLLRLTSVTLPPWVIFVTYFPPVKWDLLLLTGFGTLVLNLVPTLETDLLIPDPILTTLTPVSTNVSRLLVDFSGCSEGS